MWGLLTSALALVAAAFLISGCGGSDDEGSTETTTASAETTTPTAGSGTTIKVAGSEFGKMLFDDKDQAIYLFDKEKTDQAECYGACAEAWPPVLTKGPPQAGASVDASKFGTTQRRDGSTQVTYGGHPLYYYGHEGPGEVLCHNVEEFGGLWLVVQPSGEPAPA